MPILGSVPIGIAIALILQSLAAYMMDAYTIYFASAMAAAIVIRSVAAAAFPLFSPPMFAALGDEWAISIFAFMAVAYMPVPFLFYVRRMVVIVRSSDLAEWARADAWQKTALEIKVRVEGARGNEVRGNDGGGAYTRLNWPFSGWLSRRPVDSTLSRIVSLPLGV